MEQIRLIVGAGHIELLRRIPEPAHSPYDATDILLCSATVPALNKNKSKKVKKIVIIPSVAPGTYYIIAIVDPGDSVTESDETNNTKVATKVITVI